MTQPRPLLRLSSLQLATGLLLALPAPAQQLCLAEGGGGVFRVATVPESNPNAPDTLILQNVEFLPIEMTGRTRAHEFDASRPRRLQRHGLWRIELPDGGRLFRYRQNGGQRWGFLHVERSGDARIVVDRAGLGGTGDPFFDRIAVAEDGRNGAVGLQSGGLVVFKLDGTTYASTGRPDRIATPDLLEESGFMVGAAHVFYVTDADRIFRCGLADGSVPFDLTPPPIPNTRLEDEFVIARDGSRIVFLYGPQNQQRLYTAGVSGGAVVLPPPPSKYEDPNYLPDGAGELEMLLSDDGSRLFYVDSDVRDELFLLDMTGALPTLQITDDPFFQPYIGVHILPKFDGVNLLAAIGDPNRMDWFRATLSASGGSVTNLTNTGAMTAPFPEGTIDPVAAAITGTAAFVIERTATGTDLRRLQLATGNNAVVRSDPTLTLARGTAVNGAVDVVARGSGGDALYAGASGALIAATPAGVGLTAPVHGIMAVTWAHLSGGLGVLVFYLPDGTTVPGLVTNGEPQVCMTAADGIVVNHTTLRYIAAGIDVIVQRPPAAQRLVLSGAGA